MPRLSALDAVNPALERTKSMLFRPVRFKNWLKIGFIAWLAGSGGAGFNYTGGSFPGQKREPGTQEMEHAIRAFLNEHVLLIVLVAALAFVIGLAFLYLSCRFRFILFDSILSGDPQIGRGWRRYGSPANRYFGFMILVMVACGIVLLLIAGLPLWHAFKSGVFSGDNPFSALLRYLVPIVLGILVLAVVAAIVTTLANDFMLPLMALEDIRVGRAWRRLQEMLSAEPGAFSGYLAMKLALSIGIGIVVGIAMLLAIVVLAIPAVILALLIGTVVKGAGLVYGLVAAAVGLFVGLALLLFLILLAMAPGAVFITSYSLFFLGGRYAPLASLLWPPPPASLIPPPTLPPPMPGAAPAI
jgi:hypothetical protein